MFPRDPIELALLNYRKGGSTFRNRLLVLPVFDDDGQVTYLSASQFDVTVERERLAQLERDRAELVAQVGQRTSALVQVEHRLRVALDAAQLGSLSLDLRTERVVVTDRCKMNFGRAVSEPFIYADIKAAIHPDDRAARGDALRTALVETENYWA